jgi:hypothetical protein
MSTKISQLTSATDITASDLMQIVDVEDGVMAPSGTNKKVTASLLAKELAKQPLEPGIVISGSSSGDAVRITQTGGGNALVVEDSTNPDATPFVVNDQGQLLIGNSTSLVGPFAYSRGLQLTNQGAQFNAFTSNEFGEGLAFVKTRGTPSSPHTIVQLNDTLGAVSFSGSDGSNYVLGSQIMSFVDQVPGAGDMPTCLTFATTPDGSTNCTERMRITSAGNVGIGTGTPTEKLDVTGNIKASQLYINNPSGDSSIEVGGAGNVYIDLKKPNSDDRDLRITTDGTDSIIDSNGGLFISTANNERMRITSTGNVGIGTATPGAELEVADNNGNNDVRINLRANASTISQIGASSTQTFIDSVGARPFIVLTNAAERMRIDSTGNVGIGTASPTSRLDVRGGNGTIANFVGSGGQFQGIGMQASDASASTAKSTFIDSKNENSVVVANVKVDMFTDGGSSIAFETTPAGSRTTDRRTENMRITSAGNVGIGTSSPSSKLHVAGDLTMSSATTAPSATAGTNGDVPAQVEGYLVVNINGTARKIPYYA